MTAMSETLDASQFEHSFAMHYGDAEGQPIEVGADRTPCSVG